MQLDLDAERIDLLYRFATAPAKGRVLEVSVNGEAVLRDRNWGDCTVVNATLPATYGKELPFPDGSFEIVVLHRALDQLIATARQEGRAFELGGFLSRVARLLTTGGIIVGCVENRYSIEELFRGIKRLLGPRAGSAHNAGSGATFSVKQCRSSLGAAGFGDVRLFSMVPGADAPSKLLSIGSTWSRRTSKRHVEALRPLVLRSRYIAWRILAELGASQYLGRAIFFVGRKEC